VVEEVWVEGVAEAGGR